MHFRHISAKIQPKKLKQHFDLGARDPWPHFGYALVTIGFSFASPVINISNCIFFSTNYSTFVIFCLFKLLLFFCGYYRNTIYSINKNIKIN